MQRRKAPDAPPRDRAAEENTVVVEDDYLRAGFTQVPNVVLRDPRISFGAKLAYSVLLSYAWQEKSCFPGQIRMGRDLGCSVRSVQTYLKELQDLGIVSVTRRGLTKTNVYTLPRLIGDPREP
jgi:hypothetical protein